jgi:hypothetical protein
LPSVSRPAALGPALTLTDFDPSVRRLLKGLVAGSLEELERTFSVDSYEDYKHMDLKRYFTGAI